LALDLEKWFQYPKILELPSDWSGKPSLCD
jgi:hypothetical protein